MRSGTTALARYVGAHPDVFMAPEKEVHFFDRHFDLGVEWYAQRFASADVESAIGEATQVYMYDELSVDRMARTVPDAKLIAILRDPVDRAYSHYWLNRSSGIEQLGFAEALEAEPERIDASRGKRFAYSYVDRGRYLHQLLSLSERFPEDAIHVAIFEDLRSDARSVYREVCEFLSIDPGFEPPDLGQPINGHVAFRSLRLRHYSKRLTGTPRRIVGRLNAKPERYEPMEPRVRASLSEMFRTENDALANWLGRELPAWSR